MTTAGSPFHQPPHPFLDPCCSKLVAGLSLGSGPASVLPTTSSTAAAEAPLVAVEQEVAALVVAAAATAVAQVAAAAVEEV